MAKSKYPKFVSPVGVAAFAWLDKTDSGGTYSDDQYKVTLLLDNEQHQDFIDRIIQESENLGKEKLGVKKLPGGFMFPLRDGGEKKEEWDGCMVMTAKTQFKPGCVDANKQVLTFESPDSSVYSGDLVRISFLLTPYKNGANKGVTAKLRNVQLIEKRNLGSSGADDFDDDFADDSAESATDGGGDGDDEYEF